MLLFRQENQQTGLLRQGLLKSVRFLIEIEDVGLALA